MFNYFKFAYDDRDIIVVCNIPFYLSTGFNSQSRGTWFPFYGVEISRDWMIKPSHIGRMRYLSQQYGEKTLTILKEYGISDSLLRRFGNLRTMCLSCSMGGDFWMQNSEIEEFLRENFSKYFLNDEQIYKHLHNDPNFITSDPELVNLILQQLIEDKKSRVGKLYETYRPTSPNPSS